MAELAIYRLNINGVPHTFQMTAEDAKARGAKPVETKAAPTPKNKARKTAPNKASKR